MSVRVDLDRLGESIAEYGDAAFVLTTGDDHRPHVTHAAVDLTDGVITCSVGRGAGANATARPGLSVLWPPPEPDGYSLILDGDATVEPLDEGNRLHITPTAAVLHRPVPRPDADPDGCTSDCVPLTTDE